MFEATQMPSDSAPMLAKQNAAASPKRDRRRLLTKIDKRGRLGRRVERLVSLFSAAFPAEALTALKREQIASAAQLQAMAEESRGLWMRGEAKFNLDELVRLERAAMSRVNALGLADSPKRETSLLAWLAGERR